jgi:polyhydroxybutyrate depolymerase
VPSILSIRRHHRPSRVPLWTCHLTRAIAAAGAALSAVVPVPGPVVSEARERGSQNAPGVLTRHIDVDGVSRTYLLQVPVTLPANAAAPLLLVFHGGGSHAVAMQRFTRFDALADRQGFIVAYPEGVRSHWNDTRGLSPADDVAFVRGLIAQVRRLHPIDERRIYATGVSNGGFFSVRLACDLTRDLAAVAAVAATMPETLVPACRPAAPISIMFMQGTQDPLVKIDGGVVARRNGRSVSLKDAVDFWRRVNHAAGQPSSIELPDRQADGTHVRQDVYRSGVDDVEVVVVTIEGGGHTWPGAVQYLPVSMVGRTSANLDATEAICAFFKRHQR